MKNIVVLFDQVKKLFIVLAIFFFPKDFKIQTRVICDLEHLLRMSHLNFFFFYFQRKGVD